MPCVLCQTNFGASNSCQIEAAPAEGFSCMKTSIPGCATKYTAIYIYFLYLIKQTMQKVCSIFVADLT